MKKFTIAVVLFASISLMSLQDNEVCPGASGQKALACGACHGGAISSDVFIIDGKGEVSSSGGSTFEYLVRVPSEYANILQLFSSGDESVYGGPKVELDFTSSLSEIRNSTLFNAVSLSQEKSNKGYNTFTVRYTFDEMLKETKTMVLQGVLSNNDGTVEGDHSFYKEIVLSPKEEGLSELNSSRVQDQAYYSQNKVVISNPGAIQSVKIIDLRGAVVQTALVDAYEVLDVAHLDAGVYFVLIGNDAQSMKTLKFAK